VNHSISQTATYFFNSLLVKRQKNDATDAEAICEAVRRPSMRFVETKTPEQQSCLVLHRGAGIWNTKPLK